jgi:hypothetical protein
VRTQIRAKFFNSSAQSIFKNSLELKEGENQKEIDLDKFLSGIYFISLRMGDEVLWEKIVKD